VAAPQHVVDHALQAYGLAIARGIDAAYTMLMQLFNLCWNNYAATAAKYLDVRCIQFMETIYEIFEIFDMSALIGAYGYGIDIFLDGGIYDLLHGAVVSEVNDLGTAGLQDTAHDIDGGIMAIEEACRGDEAEPFAP